MIIDLTPSNEGSSNEHNSIQRRFHLLRVSTHINIVFVSTMIVFVLIDYTILPKLYDSSKNKVMKISHYYYIRLFEKKMFYVNKINGTSWKMKH